MPRIDPQQLLKCLSVLLSSNGGIKSQDEVQRLASLMTKFSKKLVSKCIYVSILKATEIQLLGMFMSAGGWNLTYNWLSDGVAAKNWPLVTELVDLLLICPVDINRLKTNACPKLIKTLSKDPSADESVRVLACKLVDLWLRIVRGDDSAPSTSEAGQPSLATSPSEFSKLNTEDVIDGEEKIENTDISGSDGHLPVYKITIRDGKKVLAEISGGQRLSSEAMEEGSSTGTEDIHQEEGESVEDEVEDNIDNDDDDEDYVVKPVKLRKKPPIKSNKQSIARKPAKVRGSNKKERESTDSGSSAGKSPNHQKAAVKPALKKTKIEQKVKSNIKNKSSSVVDDDHKSEIANIKSNSINNDTEKTVNAKPKGKINLSLKNKTNAKLTKEKERNDKKIDKFDIKERKMLENNDKSKKKVESYDSLTDKEKESLSKFITPPISKLGKIPKKSASNKEEKQSEEKNRTLKEETTDNKLELKKASDTKKLPDVKRPEKKYSMSVGLKRSLPNESRPKTVKTYNSKFRSTGLEEEVKPPPSKAIPKKPTTSLFSSPLSLPEKKCVKRSSPPPPDNTIPEKKPKIDPTIEEKKTTEKVGGIKLIPPKPKR